MSSRESNLPTLVLLTIMLGRNRISHCVKGGVIMILEDGLHIGTRLRKLTHSKASNERKAEQLFRENLAIPGGAWPVGRNRRKGERLQERINILTR